MRYALKTWSRPALGLATSVISDFVAAKVETVDDDNAVHLAADQRPELHKVAIYSMICRHDERAPVRCPFCERERSRCDIHLPVAHKNVTVAAEPPEALVLVRVSIVRVQEAPMAQNQIEHRVSVAVRIRGVAPEDIVDLPPVVLTARHLAIAVVVRLAAGTSEALKLVPFRIPNEPEIGIGVPARRVEVQPKRLKALLEPILKVEFFVAAPLALDEFPVADGSHANLEDGVNARHSSNSSSCRQ